MSKDSSLAHLEALIQRGRDIRHTQVPPSLDARDSNASSLGAAGTDVTPAWQRDCAAAINQLSGGSKAHWLARAYSGAFLVRSVEGEVVVEAAATEIVDRILGVLAQGAAALSRIDDIAAASSAAPRPRQFEFVHNAELRPVLEQAFADSRDALERGDPALALILSCSIIEALLTDALDHARPRADDAAEGGVAGGSFEPRIAAAERAGLIRGGCARLPPVARRYRDLTDAGGELRAGAQVTEREARLAGQVLRVVMRDLDPGR